MKPMNVILTRITDEEMQYITKAAEKNMITTSEYLRRLIIRDMTKGGLRIVKDK